MKKKPAPAPKRTPPTLTWEEIGSGITKRQVPKFTGLKLPEEIAIRRSVKVPLPDTLDFAVTTAARFLDKYGIEYRPDGDYHTEDGRAHTLIGYVIAKGQRPYESPIWYSASIIHFSFLMLKSIAEGNAQSAADLGFMIGRLHAEAKLKGKWEPDALLGVADRKTRKRGGEKTGEKTAAAAQVRNAQVLRMNADLLPRHPSERERAAIIARKVERPVDTIRDILKRSK